MSATYNVYTKSSSISSALQIMTFTYFYSQIVFVTSLIYKAIIEASFR